MFATLVGTNYETSRHVTLFTRLRELAVSRGFLPPDSAHRPHRDQTPLDGWVLEEKLPSNSTASFYLAVTAPRMPGISPIPVQKTIGGPLFAVVAMDSFYIVSREDRRDVSEYHDSDSVERSFSEFLNSLKPETDGDSNGETCNNTNTRPVESVDTTADNAMLCQICKKRPGKTEYRISPPMRMVEVRLCDQCSKSVIY
jgi:hypothetical protein